MNRLDRLALSIWRPRTLHRDPRRLWAVWLLVAAGPVVLAIVAALDWV